MSSEEFKRVLYFNQANNRDYEGLCGAIKTYMTEHEIINRNQAGEDKWMWMVDWVVAHPYMENTRQKFLDEGLE